jgi:DNA-binding winged helix-turn-helix (wHTH) protein/tetratricopeptide (TPR) repeat protein
MVESGVGSRVIRFGLFEVDLGARELRRDARQIKIQDRPFDILSILLEHPGEIVTRDEFRRRLWSADTFVDFDHSLNASINKLRQALDDDAGNPRFVATAGRRGYKFIAPVSRDVPTIAGAGTGPGPALDVSDTSPNAAPAVDLAASLPRVATRWSWGVLAAGLLVLVAAVVGTWVFFERSRRVTPSLNGRDSILLAEFDNSTGDSVFDDTLKQALAVQLEQSPFLNLVPDERVREILGYMGRSPDTRMTTTLAFELCQREGIKGVLAGSIARLGSQYVISLTASNCRDGGSLGREQVQASRKEEVLHALGEAAAEMRRKLGETLASIQKFDAPIEEATTPSIDAMKAFTVAFERRSRGLEAEAIPFYERAIALDPNFAMAYAHLGTLYANIDEVVRGSQYLRKAFELRNRVSEPERLYITTRYFDVVEGDLEKSIQTYDVWTQTYSQDWRPFNNLAVVCLSVGDFEKAEAAARQALSLNPNHVFPYSNLGAALLGLGRFGDAQDTCQRAIVARRENVGLRTELYQIAFDRRDLDGMNREVEWCRDKTRVGDMLFAEAQGAASLGKLREARKLFASAIASAQAHSFTENAATSAALHGLIEVELGKTDIGREEAKTALKSGAGVGEQGIAALALARAGDTTAASRVAAELERRFPFNTEVLYVRAPTILAAVQITRGNAAAAIALLDPATRFELGVVADFTPIYLRGVALLKAGAGADAAREFQKIIDHRGVNTVSPFVSLAHLGVARSFALSGDTARSRQWYERFLAIWKDADPDLPLLAQARSEYARAR